MPKTKTLQIILSLTDKNKLYLENNNLVVEVKPLETELKKHKHSLSTFSNLIVIGHCSLTTPLIAQLTKANINLLFLNSSFRISFCSPAVPDHNAYLLKLKQYQIKQNTQARINLAKKIIIDKVKSQLTASKLTKKAQNLELKKLVQGLENVNNIDTLMGIEGGYSTIYFNQVFSDYNWKRRLPRQKEDYLNYLLDINYTYLYNYTAGLVEISGLDKYVGFLHEDRYNRFSLVCDIMEPFRIEADRILIKALNLKIIKSDIFEQDQKTSKTLCVDRKKLAHYLEYLSQELSNSQPSIEAYIKEITEYVLIHNI